MDSDERDGQDADAARHSLFGGLLWWCEHKGYKAVWSVLKFRKMFGRKPNGEAKAEPQAPSEQLLHWVSRDNAAYKARMRAIEARSSPGETVAESPLMSADDWNTKL
jgi:hypothetical protein